jgi:hypothetical protein
MARLLFLQPSAGPAPGFLSLAPEGTDVWLVPETTLGHLPPRPDDALIVPMHVDQRLFAGFRAWIEAFLNQGGTLLFCGPLAHPFLPESRPFAPLPRRGLEDLTVTLRGGHPIHAGITGADLTLRRGVAGFHGRGANPPPPGPGVEVIATVGGGVPLTWIWRRPAGGRLFMHAGNDPWMFWTDDTPAARLAPQLLAWALTPDLPLEERRRA